MLKNRRETVATGTGDRSLLALRFRVLSVSLDTGTRLANHHGESFPRLRCIPERVGVELATLFRLAKREESHYCGRVTGSFRRRRPGVDVDAKLFQRWNGKSYGGAPGS